MSKDEFNDTLNALGLSRAEFCELTGLAYSSVSNWSNEKPPPKWVRSYLVLYAKAKAFDEVIERIKPLIPIP